MALQQELFLSEITKGSQDNLIGQKLMVADLYAGVGGIGLGFSKHGFETAFAVDVDPYCKPTYDLNHGNSKLQIADIGNLNIDELPNFEILLAGFPCQPFSVAGYRKGFEDTDRGNQFFNLCQILEARRPQAFLLENVKNLKGHDNGNTFRVIENSLRALGYSIDSKVLNSMEYGNVPQTRERIFIAGFLNRAHFDAFKFPCKTPVKATSLTEFLEQEVKESYYYRPGQTIYAKLKESVVRKDTVYQFRRHYVRENKSNVCPTLTANMGMGGHNVPIILDAKGIRKLTPRECFNLQGYDPSSFSLPKNMADSRLYKQAGNSVSVTVIERIAEQFAVALDA